MEVGREGSDSESQAHAGGEDEAEAQEVSAPEAGRAKSFKIMHPRRPKRPSAPSPSTRFSVLPILSAVLGLTSFLLPWVTVHTDRDDEFLRLTEYMTSYQDYSAVYAMAGMLVLVGSAICFLWRYGALLSLAGVILFVLDRPTGSSEVGIGLVVGAAAAVIGCVSIVWSPNLRFPSRTLSISAHPIGGYRVNLLSLVAFALGAASVALAWLVIEQSFDAQPVLENSYTLAYLMEEPDMIGGLGLYVAEAMVLAGAGLCLLTPVGGVVMLSGVVLFFLEVRDSLGTVEMYQFARMGHTTELGYGFYICLVASMVAIVSLFRTYEIRVPAVTETSRPDVPTADAASPVPPHRAAYGEARSLTSVMADALRPAAVLVVALLIIIAAVGVSYALSFSTIKVGVFNGDASSSLEVAVFVDGELVDVGVASPGASFIAECPVTAGSHYVELDYAFLSYVLEGVDGLPDWSGSVEVDPFLTRAVYAVLMIDDMALPVVTLGAEGTTDGERMTVESAVNYAYGVETTADINWWDVSLVLTDGTDFSEWEPEYSDFSGEPLCDVGWALLGDLNITCTVTDLAADGTVSQGDYFDLSVTTGSFPEDVPHTLYLLYWGSAVGEVSFTG